MTCNYSISDLNFTSCQLTKIFRLQNLSFYVSTNKKNKKCLLIVIGFQKQVESLNASFHAEIIFVNIQALIKSHL